MIILSEKGTIINKNQSLQEFCLNKGKSLHSIAPKGGKISQNNIKKSANFIMNSERISDILKKSRKANLNSNE